MKKKKKINGFRHDVKLIIVKFTIIVMLILDKYEYINRQHNISLLTRVIIVNSKITRLLVYNYNLILIKLKNYIISTGQL